MPAIVTTYSQPGTINKDGRPFGGNRVAADPRVYPPGTILRLTWHRKTMIADVSDTGGKVHGQHLDMPVVKMSSWIGVYRREAARTTLHHVRVEVVRWGHRRPKRRHRRHL